MEGSSELGCFGAHLVGFPSERLDLQTQSSNGCESGKKARLFRTNDSCGSLGVDSTHTFGRDSRARNSLNHQLVDGKFPKQHAFGNHVHGSINMISEQEGSSNINRFNANWVCLGDNTNVPTNELTSIHQDFTVLENQLGAMNPNTLYNEGLVSMDASRLGLG